MKKLYLLFFVLMAVLLGACDNDEIAAEQSKEEKTAPQLKASVAQGQTTTKSGVIEDSDYTLGEKFYWSNEDATTVFFVSSGTTNPSQYKKASYKASVAQGVQSNNCTFDVVEFDDINDGRYTAYGLYPTSAWEVRTDYYDFLMANIPVYQIQAQPNSTHLGAYMLMKAQNDVMVEGENAINLTYKHLASVLRFAVWNSSGNNDLKLANINVSLSSGEAVFNTIGKLDDIDDSSLTPDPVVGKSPSVNLSLTGAARNFSTKDEKDQCEGYMVVLPTATDAFEASDDLIIELSLTDGTNNYIVRKTYKIGTHLGFFSNGIEQGKSYYFQLQIDPFDILSPITGTSYTVGDYWPNDTNPEGIVFWVRPGSLGTQGKVVALNETYVSQWGPDNDEENVGVTGIRSCTDGATATKNMITKYKSSLTFGDDYPAFFYVYNTVNSNNESGAWYLPARDEIKMLFAGYSGKIYERIVNWTSSNMPDYNSAECIASRLQFNTKLTNKGGDAFGASGNAVNWWYLSSSEISVPSCYTFSFEEGLYGIDPKKLGANIRWIREY